MRPGDEGGATGEDVRGVFNPVLVLQDGLDVRVGDDHVVQLQLRLLALCFHGANEIHGRPVKQGGGGGGTIMSL